MKGKFAGQAMHIEYYTVDPKKKKAADCIHLTTDRICQNPKSYYYLSKCFAASWCPLKLKEKDAVRKANVNNTQVGTVKREPKIIKIQCSLPVNCKIYSEKLGVGKFISYDEKNMLISVRFGEKIIRFKYPTSITDRYLILPKDAYQKVLNDIGMAEKG